MRCWGASAREGAARSAAGAWHARARPCFGTLLRIRARGLPARFGAAVLSDAFALAERFHAAMSRQSPESDLSALLRLAPGETLRVRDETRAVLRFALDLAEQTDGLFDPVMPGPRGREASWRDVVLSADGDLRLRRPLGVSLDGVAKGFAADRICQWLRERGARDAIVDAGGDLALACADPQPIGIRDPHRPGAIARVIELARGGVASSGNYGRISELWGREGPAGRWPRAVTVVARDCAMADALTKVAADPRAAAVLARLGAREAA